MEKARVARNSALSEAVSIVSAANTSQDVKDTVVGIINDDATGGPSSKMSDAQIVERFGGQFKEPRDLQDFRQLLMAFRRQRK